MSIEFICSNCNTTLRVPDEHLGKNARCPACQTINLIQPGRIDEGIEFGNGSSAGTDIPTYNPYKGNSTGQAWDTPSAAIPNPYASTGYSEQTRYRVPHRGGLILTLGIVSFFCNVFLVPGILAWIFGSGDLKQMKAGLMDRSGESLTMIGMVLGIIATVIPLLIMLLYVAIIIFSIFIALLSSL